MIKAVVFDAGGVLLKWNYIAFMNNIYRKLGIRRTASWEDHPDFPHDLNRGTMTIDEAMPKVLGEKLDKSQLTIAKEYWTSCMAPKDGMAQLVRSLKPSYKLAVLSNTDAFTAEPLVQAGVYRDFDITIFSYEHGTIKPEQRIYDILIERLGVPPEECVFIDDRQKNLVPAEKMGMKTILFKSVDQLSDDLRKIGIRF